MNFDIIVQQIKLSESCLNYDIISAPFTPNTFSLWREVNYQYLNQEQWFDFVKIIDQELFQRFLEKVREAYSKKLTYNDLRLDIRYDIDIKKLQQVFEKDLKKQVDTITNHLSYYQAQIEYAYDLLRRIHTYKFVKYSEGNIDHQGKKDQTLYQKYLDKIMKNLISNVQEIATEKIKDFCATGLVKNYSFLETGKQFVKQFLFSGGAVVSKISNLNLGLFIGGLIAEQVVSRVALSIVVSRVSAKLDILQLEIDQMTNELTYINSDLEHLIFKAAEEYPNNYELHKTYISAFVQKNYKVKVGSDYIYCPETNSILQTQELDDCIMISEQEYNVPISEETIDDTSILNIQSNLKDSLQIDYF